MANDSEFVRISRISDTDVFNSISITYVTVVLTNFLDVDCICILHGYLFYSVSFGHKERDIRARTVNMSAPPSYDKSQAGYPGGGWPSWLKWWI